MKLRLGLVVSTTALAALGSACAGSDLPLIGEDSREFQPTGGTCLDELQTTRFLINEVPFTNTTDGTVRFTAARLPDAVDFRIEKVLVLPASNLMFGFFGYPVPPDVARDETWQGREPISEAAVPPGERVSLAYVLSKPEGEEGRIYGIEFDYVVDGSTERSGFTNAYFAVARNCDRALRNDSLP